MDAKFRWLAGAGLCACVIALQSGLLNGARETGEPARDAPDAEATARPVALALPIRIDDEPRPIALTAAMLRDAVRAGRLVVSTATGAAYEVREVRQQSELGGRWSVIGRVDTQTGRQSMVLTVGPDAIFGVLPRPDGRQLHVTTTRGSTAVALAGGLAPPGSGPASEPDFAIPPNASAARAPGHGSAPILAASDATADVPAPSRIDVLGVYTENLVILRGSVSAAETEVANLFAITNQAHVDSETGVVVRVVGMQRVVSDPARTNRTVLDDITYNRIEGVDLVALRNSLAADLVALVRPYNEGNGSCGVAWLAGSGLSPASATPTYGFSVNNIAPCSPYVLAHEIGHNMGSMHDVVTSTSNGSVTYGAYPFSFGYRQSGPPAFATIMAYPASGQPRVGFFSSPASSRCGAPCGRADEADNVRSLKLMASRIAAFRGPAGTVSILDADAYEPEPGLWSSSPRLTVRYSGIAPADGIRFTLQFAGGSAIAGVDYQAPTQATFSIPAGQSEVDVEVPLLADSLVEADETVEVRLVDVVGATVDDGIAHVTLRNDDPRVQVSGRVRFPAGSTVPTTGFDLQVSGLNGDAYHQAIRLSPPDFEYRLPAVPRANLSVYADVRGPLVNLPVSLPDVRTSRSYHHEVVRGVLVSGRVRVPEGDPMPVAPLYLSISATVNGQFQPLPYTEAWSPGFDYAVWVMPDAWVRIEATPQAPYQRFLAIRTRVRTDWAQDILLSQLPGVVLWASPMLPEGGGGTRGNAGAVVQLTSPAPAGGVRMRYATADGSAIGGSDFRPVNGVLEFAPGETSKYLDIEWYGDDIPEGDEHFRVLLGEISGANPVTTELTLWIDEQDPVMGTPLPADRAP